MHEGHYMDGTQANWDLVREKAIALLNASM